MNCLCANCSIYTLIRYRIMYTVDMLNSKHDAMQKNYRHIIKFAKIIIERILKQIEQS